MNISNVKEIHFIRNDNNTFGGYVVVPVFDKSTTCDIKIQMDKVVLSNCLDSINVLSYNGTLLSYEMENFDGNRT